LVVSLLAAFSQGWLLEWCVISALAVEVMALTETLRSGRRFWRILEALEGSS
jgi:hypothetical protein